MIRFYRRDEVPYGVFSNFALGFPIRLDGDIWPTTEHYFQAMKFEDPALRRRVRSSNGPGEAAKLGRRLKPPRPDWESTKYGVMKIGVRFKFAYYPQLAELLLSTGDEELVEATTTDLIWGCGSDGTGMNWLGKILMEVRAELRGARMPSGLSR